MRMRDANKVASWCLVPLPQLCACKSLSTGQQWGDRVRNRSSTAWLIAQGLGSLAGRSIFDEGAIVVREIQ